MSINKNTNPASQTSMFASLVRLDTLIDNLNVTLATYSKLFRLALQ